MLQFSASALQDANAKYHCQIFLFFTCPCTLSETHYLSMATASRVRPPPAERHRRDARAATAARRAILPGSPACDGGASAPFLLLPRPPTSSTDWLAMFHHCQLTVSALARSWMGRQVVTTMIYEIDESVQYSVMRQQGTNNRQQACAQSIQVQQRNHSWEMLCILGVCSRFWIKRVSMDNSLHSLEVNHVPGQPAAYLQ